MYSNDFLDSVSGFEKVLRIDIQYLVQYSQYHTAAGAATPQKSPAVATVGGEHGGRGVVVVEDKLGQAANLAPEDSVDTTTIAFGQAEPGHDVFGGNDLEKSKSQFSQPAAEPVEAQESKQVSVVQASPETTETSQAAESSTNETETEAEAPSSSSPESASGSQAEPEKTEGPPGEVEAEAERAREELFPEGQ